MPWFKRSIVWEWTLSIMGLTLGIILFMLFLSQQYLLPYYVKRSQGRLQERSLILKKSFEVKDINSFLMDLETLSGESDFRFILLSPELKILGGGKSNRGGGKKKLSKEQTLFIAKVSSILKESNKSLYSSFLRRDKSDKSDLLGLIPLSRGYSILVSRSLVALEESLSYITEFLLVIGALMVLFSGFISYILALQMAKPLISLSSMAQEIAKRNTYDSFDYKKRNEISQLRDNLVSMAHSLNLAFTDLEREMDLQRRFFAGVSHEFKTPVGLIRGYGESLQAGLYESSEEREEFIKIIIEESDRLNQLICDLLFVVQSSSASFQLKKEALCLSEQAERALERFFSSSDKKNIQIKNLIEPHIYIKGDSFRVAQILDNCLSNAIRHLPQDGLLELTLKQSDQWAILTLYNQGDCIKEEDLKHIFDPFYLSEFSRSRGGTGLGLSIVKNLVTLHGGTCSLSNKEGGVIFKMRVPTLLQTQIKAPE